MRNPNETQGQNVETITAACPVCGMLRDEWTVNEGKGVKKDDKTYCCEGCADGTGCTC